MGIVFYLCSVADANAVKSTIITIYSFFVYIPFFFFIVPKGSVVKSLLVGNVGLVNAIYC